MFFHCFIVHLAEFGEWWGVGLFVVDIFWRQDNLKFTRRVQHRLSELQLKVDSLVAASPTSQEYLREQLEENVDDQIINIFCFILFFITNKKILAFGINIKKAFATLINN